MSRDRDVFGTFSQDWGETNGPRHLIGSSPYRKLKTLEAQFLEGVLATSDAVALLEILRIQRASPTNPAKQVMCAGPVVAVVRQCEHPGVRLWVGRACAE